MAAQQRPSGTFTINTSLNDHNYFVHSVTMNNSIPEDRLSVPRKIQIKMQCVINSMGRMDPHSFFDSIGCLVKDEPSLIDMLKLNIVKQYLDMIKDGTSPVLMRQLMGTFLTEQGINVAVLRYPVTLDAIKEYFNKHYNEEGKLHKVFWARNAEFPGFTELLNTPSIHDCGFKPGDRNGVVGPSTGIDPLAQGKVKERDILFPTTGSSITWSDITLQSLGYPPGCSITATNSDGGGVGEKVNWAIEVVCSVGNMRVKANDSGIWNVITGKPISIKGIATIQELKQGNTFKSYIQSQTNSGDAKNLPLLLILLALVFIKSFGDNSIDLTQRSAQLIEDLLAIIFTCDFTLFLSAMTWGGMAVLTTNAPDMDLPGRTGNLSTLFLPRELAPGEEIDDIFKSCRAENEKYLTMLKHVYAENTPTRTVKIKIGGETKDIHLWFLHIIIKAIETCMENHLSILRMFRNIIGQLNKNDWFSKKNDILSLFKSYCKIVFPFVAIDSTVWRVFAIPTLISNSPRPNVDLQDFITQCQEKIDENKNSLKPQIKLFIDEIATKGKHISIKTINLQQLAILIGKYAIPIKDFEVPTLEGAVAAVGEQGGGRNRNYNLTGGMDPNPKRQKLPPPVALPLPVAVAPPPAAAAAAEEEEEEEEEEEQQEEEAGAGAEEEEEEEAGAGAGAEGAEGAAAKQQQLEEQEALAVQSTAEFTSIMRNIMAFFGNFEQNTGVDPQPEILYLFYEIKKPVYTLILILVSSCLSQLLKYLSLLITEPGPSTDFTAASAAAGAAGDGDDAAAAVAAKTYQMSILTATRDKIGNIVNEYKTLKMLHNIEGEVNVLDNLVRVMNELNGKINGNNKLNLACLYSIFENTNENITGFLLANDIIPSSDTLVFAMSRLNLSIFYNCVIDVTSGNPDNFHTMYITAQTNKDYSEYIPIKLHIGKITPGDYSFYEEYYSLMKNIAYNVFYTFEYLLPLSCDEHFGAMRSQLIEGFKISIEVPMTVEYGLQHVIMAVPNVDDLLSQASSSLSSPSSSPSPAGGYVPTIAPNGSVPRGVPSGRAGGGAGGGFWGGSSTRTRRRRNLSRRTQYTNKKNKRSSKSTKHNTIKHRKSYRKHNRTIKRRSYRK